jgi:hypothetical protein
MAEMQVSDGETELEAIRSLPLEKRYVWRVASALKGFADFDNVNVDADRRTMTGRSRQSDGTPAISPSSFVSFLR